MRELLRQLTRGRSATSTPAPPTPESLGNLSFAQCGEDVAASFALETMGRACQRYLDIGASDPVKLNNTYFFYRAGASGVCVEPDPELAAQLRSKRPRDTVVAAGMAAEPAEAAEFYIMQPPTLNTFCREDAQRLDASGLHPIREVVQLPLRTINDVLEEHFPDAAPDFLSLDVEGLNYDIVRTMDTDRWRPPVMCIETLTYTTDRTSRRITEIMDVLENARYRIFADTYINTVFVSEENWIGS